MSSFLSPSSFFGGVALAIGMGEGFGRDLVASPYRVCQQIQNPQRIKRKGLEKDRERGEWKMKTKGKLMPITTFLSPECKVKAQRRLIIHIVQQKLEERKV